MDLATGPYLALLVTTKIVYIDFENSLKSGFLLLENLTLTKLELKMKKYILPCLVIESPGFTQR